MRANASGLSAPRTGVLALGAAGITLVLWSSAFVGIRAAGNDFSPGALALGRLAVAAIVLGVIVACRRDPLPHPRDLPLIALCGLLWLGAYSVLLNAAERRVDAGTAAMLVNVGPILIALLAGWLLAEGYPGALFAGCAIAFVGVALIATSTSDGGRSGSFGVVLCLLAALGYAGGVVTEKVVLRRVSALQTVFFACVSAAIACSWAAPSLIREAGGAPASNVAWVVYLGLFPTAIGFITWAYALARTSAGRLAATTYLVPGIAILIGWMLLGETPPALAFVGGAICLAGVAVTRNLGAGALVSYGMRIFSRDPKREELRRIPLFAALPRRQFDLLTRAADVLDVPACTDLIREGESGHEFFAIADGEVEICQAGKRVATEHAGDVFGEIALLHGVPRTASVTTTVPSRLVVLNEQTFRSLLARSFA